MQKRSVLGAILLLSSLAHAISKELKATVDWETKSNAVSTRSNEEIKIEHFEIPLSVLTTDVAANIDPSVYNSLVFTKADGQQYVRWVINPEDKTHYLKVKEYLMSQGLDATKYQFFTGYMTASRSYIVVNPENQAEFSVKVSTDTTGGNWTDKKQTLEDALQIRKMMDYINTQVQQSEKLQNVVLLDEPAIFGIKALDQGMVIRSYSQAAKTGRKYIPGFSVMYETTGRELAHKNGSNNPAKYWDENYNKPLARALAEFYALTGIAYDSPHSQNFMVELDANDKPTGRIALRDFGDVYLNESFFEAKGRLDLVKAWEQDNIIEGKMRIAVGILHGNKDPSWMDTVNNTTNYNSYNKWGRDFFEEFNKEMHRQTGTTDHVDSFSRSGKYLGGYVNSSADFLNLVELGVQRANIANQCSFLFALD